jgi:catechol 2,3-dioxygenase-like lactoylglutathione lyase family enzyme
MFGSNQVMSSFSVDDVPAAKAFYTETLGFEVDQEGDGLLIKFGGGGQAMVYPKSNHEPATFTVLHIVVDDVEQAVDALTAKGVTFEHYTEESIKTDEKGIARDTERDTDMAIAWFQDPAGNIIGLLQMPSA